MENNLSVMRRIFDEIETADHIILMRHIRPDGDAVGSAKGFQRILRCSFPEKRIEVINEDTAAYLAFMGGEDAPIPDEEYADALGIVLDTGTADRISNKKYPLCREIVRIDHHIDEEPYGDIAWVEERRSSTCEMIVAFYEAFRDRLVLDPVAANYLYAGIVTDSGRFRYESTDGDTLRLSAMLLDVGVDTERLYANLYLDDFDALGQKGVILRRIRRTANGVAYYFIPRALREKYGMTMEQASNFNNVMDSIRGSIIWLAFIETDDGSIRVRLRSRFVTIQELAARYHGGGHDRASGATVYSRREMNALLRDADKLIKDYKEHNEGWL